jgi:hypothetical protein
MSDPIFLCKEYVIVVDTDKSSYSFIKDFCAYCTGYNHESLISSEYSKLFYEDMKLIDDNYVNFPYEKNPFNGFLTDKLDHDGYLAPCSVWLNKNFGMDCSGRYELLTEENFDEYSYPAPLSVGFFFNSEPSKQQIEIIKTRSKKFFELFFSDRKFKVNILGYRMIVHTKYGEEIDLS